MQMIGHAGQGPTPGDYFTGTIADINYLVVRGDDNQLRAFHNVRLSPLRHPCLSCNVKLMLSIHPQTTLHCTG